MKKIYIIIILFAVGVSAKAQELGIVGGATLSHGTIISLDDKASFNSIPSGGFHIGGLFEMNISNRWGFSAAAMYELRNMSWVLRHEDMDHANMMNRQLGYLNIPFHLFVDFPLNNKQTFSMFGGPYFGCGLHGTDKAWEMTDLKKPVTFEQEDMFGEDGRVVRCEVGAEVGFAFKWRQMQLRVSYLYSFNNSTFNKYQYTLPLEKTPTYFTQGELKVSFAYLFELTK